MRLQWVGCCIRLLAGFCLVGALFTATPALADQLGRLYQQILRNPENIELNLRYAELALERGQRRKALAAYERILDVDPDNRAALEGLRRITVGLTPTTTRGRLEVGARWESNVRELPQDHQQAGRSDRIRQTLRLRRAPPVRSGLAVGRVGLCGPA